MHGVSVSIYRISPLVEEASGLLMGVEPGFGGLSYKFRSDSLNNLFPA